MLRATAWRTRRPTLQIRFGGITARRAVVMPGTPFRPSRPHPPRRWATLLLMSFSPEDLARIGAAKVVRIETQAPGGAVHRTPIWAVVDDDRVFIRTWKGANSRWYREATANPAVALHVDGRRLTA